MPEARDQFSETFFRRFVDDWVVIYAFRRVASAGLPHAREAISADSIVQRLLQDSGYAQIFTDLDSAGRAEAASSLAQSMTETAVANARAAIDAASVVFAHSILDGAAYELCRASALISPLDWEESVGEKRIRLADMKGASYEALVKAALGPFFEDLERKSLLQKIDLLFQRCPPPKGWAPMDNYRFERERIEAFDNLRHDITHGKGPREVPGLDTELDYLSRTTLFLISLVNYRYKIKIDLSHATRRRPL